MVISWDLIVFFMGFYGYFMGFNCIFMGFYGYFMGFNGIFMGFYGYFMGLNCICLWDSMVISWDLMVFFLRD